MVGKGVAVDSCDKDGDIALGRAAFNGRLASVKLVLDLGASVNAATHSGLTALMAASWRI